MLRNPKTAQEKRKSLIEPELVRPKRRFKNTPSAWSDMVRSDVKDKSWKQNKRRKQWER